MKPHYKKEATIGKYTIGIRDNYSVEVLIDGKVYDGMVMPLLRDEIAPQVGLKVDPKWNTQDLGRKLVEWINEIENLKSPNSKKSTGKSIKTNKVNVILINVMYSGSYIKNDLGHECINLFATDNGQHFIYINPLGKFAKDKLSKYNIECVLLGQLVRTGVIKVLAKATGLTILESTENIINNTKANDRNPLEPILANKHVEELNNKMVCYDGVFIDDLFDEPTQVLATFKAESVTLVNTNNNFYIYEYGKKIENNNNFVLPEADHNGNGNDFKFAKTNPYMYFPESNDQGVHMNDYDKLLKIIKNKSIWGNQADMFNPKNISPISMIEIMRKEDSELAYSNMIAYWLNQNKAIITEFVKFLKKKDSKINLPSSNSVIKIEREYKNIDVLINYDNTHIIIENKINAGISEYNVPTIPNQLVKYRKELTTEFPNGNIHCFLLTPDYRKIDLNKYDSDYKSIKYSDLYDFFNKNKAIINDPLGKEFCKALALHKEVVDNSNFINMQRRMAQAIASKKKVRQISSLNFKKMTNNHNLSKSRYTAFCQCPKNLWLKVNKPDEATEDLSVEARFERGNEVGDEAEKLFCDYVEVTTKKADDSLDIPAMVKKTKEEMAKGAETICEASFAWDDNFCAVDILHRNGDGWDIYEVKSTSFPECDGEKSKIEKYAPDIAYQKWLLEKCGVKVTNTYLVCLSSNYVRHGDLDLQHLFVVLDMNDFVDKEYQKVATQVKHAMEVLCDSNEPATDLSNHCMKPYKCGFLDYCKRQHGVLEGKPTVFDIYNMNFSEKLKYYQAGHISFDDMLVELQNKMSSPKYIKNPTRTLPIQVMQVECTLDKKEYINVDGIREFLLQLSYPLYFLDFETMQDAVPRYDKAKVYAQITFQYSLHIKESADAHYQHKKFLAPSDGSDPRRAVAEQLCKDIPMDVCTLAYNKEFECGRIKELASLYPDLSEHLLNIGKHIIDLIDPFRAGYYYVPAMGGSFSIKSVLPALFPDDPSLNYHELDERCQNGGDAMTLFPKIQDMSVEEAKASREALLRYCELDTWAMVKIWEKLVEVAK